MMLRIAAAVAVVLGVVILMLYLDEVGKLPWESPPKRVLREMKERTALPPAYDSTTFAAMAALPRSAPLAEYTAIEQRAVTLAGYVQRLTRAPDGDIHLDFADTLEAEGRLVPFLSAEITPQWHVGSDRWRFERLQALFRPYVGGPTRWDAPPRRVRLSGWLLYDFPYEGAAPVFGFPAHLTMWEIHPVTRIEAWDDSLGRYVEFER
jgi:hypothetical protein